METIIKLDSHGKKRMFDIRVDRLEDGTANIVKTTGLVDGKKQTSVTHVPLGYESALKRATTMWKNQQAKDVLPMLAHKYEERKKYMSDDMFIQPKLDGVRLLVNNKGGISRTGKVVPGTENWGSTLKDGEYLDGEAYVHGMDFESITSAFRVAPDKLEFHIFDYYDSNRPQLTFEDRFEIIKKIKNHPIVKTQRVSSKDELSKVHDQFAEQGYEGIMIRNPKSIYAPGKRSNDLLKMKVFETEEFEIVGVHEGTGRDVGTPIWECKTSEGHVFSVRPEGSVEFRRKAFKDRQNLIGKMLTVRFQNMTVVGVPRFPVGLAIRDYE